MKFLVSLFISFIFVNADINVNYNKQAELQDLTYTSHYNNKQCVLLDNEFKTKLLYAIHTVPEIKTELAINVVGRMVSVEIYDNKTAYYYTITTFNNIGMCRLYWEIARLGALPEDANKFINYKEYEILWQTIKN